MRTLEQLTDVDDPGIALLREWATMPGANPNVVLPPDMATRGAALRRLQVTTRSLLGAVVYETGGLLVCEGRLRVFGSGARRSFLEINEALTTWGDDEVPGVLMIADDDAGGLYALNGGRLGQDHLGQVFHLPADGTRWSSLDVGYADFVAWCLTGDLSFVREDCGRYAYPDATAGITVDKVRSFYPFLWTREAHCGAPDVRLIDADESLRLRIGMLGWVIAT